jgi:hypothetical protein
MQSVVVGLLSQMIDAKSMQRSMLPALLSIASSVDAPDLLLCAGYTFGHHGELARACKAFQRTRTLVIAEDNVAQKKSAGSLCWIYRGKAVRVGNQQMARPFESEAHANRAIGAWGARMRENPRLGLEILWINCGEVFVFKGGVQDVSVRHPGTSASASAVLKKADLIVHPTHTRMARRFVVDRIAAALTIGRVAGLSSRYPKVYVHASNWDADEGQHQNREALHKAFVRGDYVRVEAIDLPPSLASRYLYSLVRIRL